MKPAEVVQVDNITKRFYLERPRTIKKWIRNIFSPFATFTVIKNFSLSVRAGELILITGKNGSGKTTLLRLIAGITQPDRGNIQVIGKVVPLIELGGGFNQDLTGRENILINATILGMQKREIMDKMESILRFSGIRKFIDIPVKRYSTGMVARLAVAIAYEASPDILLMDEVFSVGDAAFQKKNLKRINDLRKKGVAVLVVSHYRHLLRNIADRVVELRKLRFTPGAGLTNE